MKFKKQDKVKLAEKCTVLEGHEGDLSGFVLDILENDVEYPIVVFIPELGRTEFFNEDELIKIEDQNG